MRKQLALVAVISIAVASVWGLRHRSAPDESATRLLADRVWIDHIPRNDKDVFNTFVLISEHSIGAFNASSAWRGNYELFNYEVNGADLRLTYPQTGQRDQARARARRCNEQSMDFCLELQGASRGVKTYYSRKGWEIDRSASASVSAGIAAMKQRVDAVRAQLESSN